MPEDYEENLEVIADELEGMPRMEISQIPDVYDVDKNGVPKMVIASYEFYDIEVLAQLIANLTTFHNEWVLKMYKNGDIEGLLDGKKEDKK